MIIACLNVYNEVETIERAIRSVAPHAQRIVVVDGCYRDRDRINGLVGSSDGTIEIVERLAQELPVELVRCPDEGWQNQAVKRSAYLLGEEGGWYLILDGDEELISFEFQPLGPIGVLCVEAKTDHFHGQSLVPRLFEHKEGIQYETHYVLNAEDGFYLNLQWQKENSRDLAKEEPFEPHCYPCGKILTHLRSSGPRMTHELRGDQKAQERVVEEITGAHSIYSHRSALEMVDEMALRLWEFWQQTGGKDPITGMVQKLTFTDVHRVVSLWAERQDNRMRELKQRFQGEKVRAHSPTHKRMAYLRGSMADIARALEKGEEGMSEEEYRHAQDVDAGRAEKKIYMHR